MELIRFILSVSGLVWILNRSKAFKSIREFISAEVLSEKGFRKLVFCVPDGLFSCYACMGFWCGVLLCVFKLILPADYYLVIESALIGSICSYFIVSYSTKM